MSVHDADKDFFVVMLVNSHAVQTGGGMFERMSDFVFEFVALIGDDREFAGVFKTGNNPVSGETRNKSVYHAKANGFVVINSDAVRLFVEYEITRQSNERVQYERNVEKVEIRLDFAYVLCNYVGAAGRGVVLDRKTYAEAHYKPRDERRINGIHAVRRVDERLQKNCLPFSLS